MHKGDFEEDMAVFGVFAVFLREMAGRRASACGGVLAVFGVFLVFFQRTPESCDGQNRNGASIFGIFGRLSRNFEFFDVHLWGIFDGHLWQPLVIFGEWRVISPD